MFRTAHPIRSLLLAGAATVSFAAAAAAAPAVGLVGDRTLVMFDTESLEVSGTVEVQDVERLLGIDMRPADGMLYGLTAEGVIVSIDPATGASTAGATLSQNLPDGVMASVDFNPAADRLRVMGSDGTNLRVHPDTGETTVDGSLAYEAGDANAEQEPNVVATAYTNSYGKPEATAMYDVTGGGLFLRQTAPNDGTLATLGELGVDGGGTYALDVQTTEDGTNTAWLVAAGALHTVNLETGAAEAKGEIAGLEGDIRDVTIMPAM